MIGRDIGWRGRTGWSLLLDNGNLLAGGSTFQTAGGMSRVTIARHWGKPASGAPTSVPPGNPLVGNIDLGMADGHVESSKLERLWTYNWHLNWKIPATRPN